MIDFNEILQKAKQEKTDTSVVFETSDHPGKAKITIEIPGQDPAVLDAVDEYVVVTKSGKHVGSISVATFPFILLVIKILKEKAEQAVSHLVGL